VTLLHNELLELAIELSESPRPAYRRRAISTAYYALFHRLAHESAARFFAHPEDVLIYTATTRALDHKTALNVCQSFAGLATPKGPVKQFIESVVVPDELRHAARSFVFLQSARHLADYDVSAKFTPVKAAEFCTEVQSAFADLDKCQSDPAFRLFLGCLLFANSWRT
jgi:hypothetical protein